MDSKGKARLCALGSELEGVRNIEGFPNGAAFSRFAISAVQACPSYWLQIVQPFAERNTYFPESPPLILCVDMGNPRPIRGRIHGHKPDHPLFR